jgi:hypothetical protein
MGFSAIPKFCRGDRPLARFGVFGKVVLHASLDTTTAGFDARASTPDICFAGFDDIYIAQQRSLASLGKLRIVLLDAPLDSALARFNSGTILLDFCATGLAHRRLLRSGSSWGK